MSTRKNFDVHDKDDVRKSLEKWTAQLRAEKKKTSALRRALHALKGRRQRSKRIIRRRKKQLKALSIGRGASAVLHAALNYRGQTEHPYGSNKGPGIVSRCQKEIIGYDGVAWCGCFVGYFLKTVAKLPISSRVAYTPNILVDARNGANGFAKEVNKNHGQAGDVITFDWNGDGVADHTAYVLENLGNGYYRTLEGNTSFDNAGSQSNGGCVAERKRHVSLILGIARPAYK